MAFIDILSHYNRYDVDTGKKLDGAMVEWVENPMEPDKAVLGLFIDDKLGTEYAGEAGKSTSIQSCAFAKPENCLKEVWRAVE